VITSHRFGAGIRAQMVSKLMRSSFETRWSDSRQQRCDESPARRHVAAVYDGDSLIDAAVEGDDIRMDLPNAVPFGSLLSELSTIGRRRRRASRSPESNRPIALKFSLLARSFHKWRARVFPDLPRPTREYTKSGGAAERGPT